MSATACSAQHTKHTFDKMTLNITDSDLDFRVDTEEEGVKIRKQKFKLKRILAAI